MTGSFIYDAGTNVFSSRDIVSEQGAFTMLASTWPAEQENAGELVIVPDEPLFFGALVPALVLLPSPELTDSGGTVALAGMGFGLEGVICNDACDGVTTNQQIDQGNLIGTAVPEPSFAFPLGLLGLFAVLLNHTRRGGQCKRPPAILAF